MPVTLRLHASGVPGDPMSMNTRPTPGHCAHTKLSKNTMKVQVYGAHTTPSLLKNCRHRGSKFRAHITRVLQQKARRHTAQVLHPVRTVRHKHSTSPSTTTCTSTEARCYDYTGGACFATCTAWPPATTVLKKKPRALAVQHANTLNENTEFIRPPGLPLRRIPAALQKGPQQVSKRAPRIARDMYSTLNNTLPPPSRTAANQTRPQFRNNKRAQQMTTAL